MTPSNRLQKAAYAVPLLVAALANYALTRVPAEVPVTQAISVAPASLAASEDERLEQALEGMLDIAGRDLASDSMSPIYLVSARYAIETFSRQVDRVGDRGSISLSDEERLSALRERITVALVDPARLKRLSADQMHDYRQLLARFARAEDSLIQLPRA